MNASPFQKIHQQKVELQLSGEAFTRPTAPSYLEGSSPMAEGGERDGVGPHSHASDTGVKQSAGQLNSYNSCSGKDVRKPGSSAKKDVYYVQAAKDLHEAEALVEESAAATKRVAQSSARLCRECVCLQFEVVPRVSLCWVVLLAVVVVFTGYAAWQVPRWLDPLPAQTVLSCGYGGQQVSVDFGAVSVEEIHTTCNTTILTEEEDWLRFAVGFHGKISKVGGHADSAMGKPDLHALYLHYKYTVFGVVHVLRVDMVMFAPVGSNVRRLNVASVSRNGTNEALCIEDLRIFRTSHSDEFQRATLGELDGLRLYTCEQ